MSITIDEDTAALVIQLQIEDSLQLYYGRADKGKGHAEELPDLQLAVSLYREELRRDAAIVADRQMTRRIAQATQADGSVIVPSLVREQTSTSDGASDCAIGVADQNSISQWMADMEELGEEVLALYVNARPSEAEVSENALLRKRDEPESTNLAATRSAYRFRRCTACQEKIHFLNIARIPCNHEYCTDCLQSLFRASMTDDSLFPPRCCRQPIPPGSVCMFLTSDMMKQYGEKNVEFETVDRTYCSNPPCSAFLHPEDITDEQATCSECMTVTCTLCKAASHGGDCPADIGLQQVLQTAAKNGWQRCYSCRRVVELDVGCNHITCHCSAQFCYACAERWKTCECPQWNEEHLIRRATQVVARQPRELVAQEVRAQVAAATENLRNRHNCDHDSWRRVEGSHRCEECQQTLPLHIFECQQCQIQACERCRRNRL